LAKEIRYDPLPPGIRTGVAGGRDGACDQYDREGGMREHAEPLFAKNAD